MQRHAVHGRRHAVLAHAVMDEAAGIIGGGEHRHALRPGVVGAGEVGRAADHFRHRRGQASSALSEAARVAISFGAAASFSFTARTAAASLSVGSSPREAALELGAAWRTPALRAARCQACARRPCRARPALRHRARTSAGMSKAGAGQPSLSRAPLISSAPSGEPWLFSVPALVGAPKPMVVRQAISDGRSEACAASIAAAIASGSCPSMRRRRPAGRLEALHLVDRIGQRQRAVDGDAVVVEQHDQLVELEVAGERDRLLADAFHQVAVGGEHVGAVIDDLAAEHGGEMPLGDRHADRVGEALAERPGRGLDARRDDRSRDGRA